MKHYGENISDTNLRGETITMLKFGHYGEKVLVETLRGEYIRYEFTGRNDYGENA